jgi:hypothetical protein
MRFACRQDARVMSASPFLDDLQDLVDEPGIDAGHVVQPFDRYEPPECGLDLEDAVGRRDRGGLYEVVVGEHVVFALGRVAVDAEPAGLQRTRGLLQRLREGAADRHDLTDRLHLCAEHRRRARQLLECPARKLGDDVVDRRFEARGRLARDVVLHLVEAVADRELGRDLRDREARRLRRERARPRHAGVHLDDDHLPGLGLHRELHVRPAGLDPDAADARERGVAHRLVLDVGEGLGGRDRDRLAGVDAHRVDVLDRTDDHDVVGVVAHHLELVLLPPRDAALDEDLGDRARGQAALGDVLHLRRIVRDARAPAAEDERRPHDDGVPDLVRDAHRLVDGVRDARRGHVQPDLGHRDLEPLPVLGGLDRVDVGTDHLDAVRVEHSGFVQADREVEPGLASERRQQRVGSFLGDDAGDRRHVERFDVRRVGELGIGHDRRRIRVHEDDAVPLLAQHATRLRSRIVELTRLPDDDRAAADQQDRFEVVAPRHLTGPHELGELLEQVAGVVGTGTGFGVVLHAERVEVRRAHTFDVAVVEIQVRDLATLGE